MIESSFHCSSSWDSDLFKDFGGIPSISEIEDFVTTLKRDDAKLSSCDITPNDLSCSSSDYESLVFDDFQEHFPVADSFISQILEESSSLGFGEPDGPFLLDAFENCDIPDGNSSTPIENSCKIMKKSQRYLSSKPWSKMSPKEQLETLHTLSDIVTCHMDIKEQIEVIKMIDPSVTISPDDKEFALDSSYLNDAKMKRIRDFIHKHGFNLSSKSLNRCTADDCFTSKKSSVSSKLFSRKSNSKTKRRQKKQKLYIDEDIRLKRKLEKHSKKEAQSGLFVYEKVIKKLSNPMEEDEDVNILE